MAKNTQDTIWGGPTKRFFVSMLTRDISLQDAILDLVDNCVDGATRESASRLNKAKAYHGYEARLTIDGKSFKLEDNCGGIPRERVKDAFLLGRSSTELDKNLPTIGMYGIGMKRAIFKMGEEATVQSKLSDQTFSVSYDKAWLDPSNDEWDLPIKTLAKANEDPGVTISIPHLRKEVARQLGNVAFQNGLKSALSEHFGYLMQKGFSIRVNNQVLAPKTLQLYATKSPKKEGVRPYDFQTRENGVEVRVTVGFFRPLSLEADIEKETEMTLERDQAGISVICNDRLVLVDDVSIRTGWGDGGVPKYHGQFRGIAGFIVFSTNEPDKLPISTTKRDLDFGSELFLLARKYCMEGLRECTDFTNKWKGMEADAGQYFEKSERVDARTQIELAAKHGKPIRGSRNSKRLPAELPVPEKRNVSRRIVFSKKEDEIHEVSDYLFDDPDQGPSAVGEECFDRMLKASRRR
jgi:hypothetical protein